MCWITERNINEKIASKDIVCFKLFREQDIVYRTKHFLGFKLGKPKIVKLNSVIQHFEYIPYKKQKSINLHIESDKPIIDFIHYKIKEYVRIEEGYHSYATLAIAKFNKTSSPITIIVGCIIPKGAVYYLNEDGEIVSSTIIVTDKIIK